MIIKMIKLELHNLIKQIYIKMQYHQKLVEEIERKMVGDSLRKSEIEKKNEIFDYDNYESQFNNLEDFKPYNYLQQRNIVISATEVENNLKQIFNFYSQAYSQPKDKYSNFQQFNQILMSSQAFFLFCKNFNILKSIVPAQRLKIYFKKHANFGRTLTLENFYFLLNSLSHDQDCRRFFRIEEAISGKGMDMEAVQQLEKQQFYAYLDIGEPQRYRKKFQSYFRPFNCKQQPELQKIKYSYRKFSLPQLKQKALPAPDPYKIITKPKKVSPKDLFITKNSGMPLKEGEGLIVSWQNLHSNRSKSVVNLKKSEQLVHKKYIKYEAEDDIYLQQYEKNTNSIRQRIQKKLQQIKEIEQQRASLVLSKLKSSKLKLPK